MTFGLTFDGYVFGKDCIFFYFLNKSGFNLLLLLLIFTPFFKTSFYPLIGLPPLMMKDWNFQYCDPSDVQKQGTW